MAPSRKRNSAAANASEPTSAKASASKRQKTAASMSKVAGTSRRKKDLSLLPTMPLDVLFEILGQLGPKDLCSLARTSKVWRSMVLSPETEFIWRDARGAYGAPDPPEDFTEERWATLLFGTACQYCSKRTTVSIDWHLLKRICKGFQVYLPGEDKSVLNYVPHTYTGVTTNSYGSFYKTSKFYWDDDIRRAIQQMKELSGDALKKWRDDAAQKVQAREAMVKIYEKWTGHLHKLSAEDEMDNRKKRLEVVKQKFLEAGYELADIQKTFDVYTPSISSGTPYITNSAWTRIRPDLERRLMVTRNKRIEEGLRPVLEVRMNILKELYDAYLDRLRPSERYYYPPLNAFRQIPEFVKLLESDKDEAVNAKEFEPLFSNLAKYLDAYHEKRRQSLWALVPKDRQDGDVTVAAPCDLAKHIFRRARPGENRYSSHLNFYREDTKAEDAVLVGWPMIGSHWCPYTPLAEIRPGVSVPLPADFRYNEGASRTSSQLISLAGLNPDTASVEEMDARDPRFVHKNLDTVIGYQVHTWRGALVLAHKLQTNAYSTSDCVFRLATPEEEAEAKQHDDPLRTSAKAWACNHCTEFLFPEKAETQLAIITHLKEKHDIVDPKPSQDFFVNQRRRLTFEKPYEVPVPGIKKYKCMCYNCKRIDIRRFTETDIQTHLKRAYPAYVTPVEGQHYVLEKPE